MFGNIKLPQIKSKLSGSTKSILSDPISIGAAVGVGAASAAISYGIDRFLATGIYIPNPIPATDDIEIMKNMSNTRDEEITRSLIAGVSGSAITLGISAPVLYNVAPKALLPAAIGGIINIIGWAIVGGIKYATWVKPPPKKSKTPKIPGTKSEWWKAAVPAVVVYENRPKLLFKGIGKVIAVDEQNRPTIIVKQSPGGYLLYKREGSRMVPAGLFMNEDAANNAIDLLILRKNSEEGQRSGLAYTVKPHFVMQSAGMVYRRH